MRWSSMMDDGELERSREESVVVCFKEQYKVLPGRFEENYENQSR